MTAGVSDGARPSADPRPEERQQPGEWRRRGSAETPVDRILSPNLPAANIASSLAHRSTTPSPPSWVAILIQHRARHQHVVGPVPEVSGR
jgi:hypothetical protein